MSFAEVMLRVLPPVNGQQPHITGHYGEQRPSGPHGGTDFNYIGGQAGINLQYPKVYAPIAGVVTFTGGTYGTIKIKDAEGNSHEILHTSSHIVSVGATVAAGDEIGAMGGQGPNGAAQYPRHVHYQMKSPTNALISPEIWWNEQSVPPTTPTTAPGPVTFSLLNFQFPIRKTGGAQYKDVDEIFTAIQAENSGHYLLGSHKFWHGGIHISNLSAPQCISDEPVRCMADGVVVAYRLNKDYLESTFEGSGGAEVLKYSSSFCLVRHDYKSPPNTQVTPNTSNTLTFYSLYMHLLPFNRYPLEPGGGTKARSKPGYWQGKVRAKVTGSGLTLRNAPASLTHGANAGTKKGSSMVLCTNSIIEFDSAKVINLKLNGKLLRMAECIFIPSSSNPPTGLKNLNTPVPSSFWACVEDVSPNRVVEWQELIPANFDIVVPMNMKIKAGDTVGYLGLNEVLASPNGGVVRKHQVHLEIFTADQKINEFLINHAGVTKGKRYLYLASGTLLTKKAPETGEVALSADHSVELSKAPIFKNPTEWYEVSVKENNQTITGLVKKTESKIISQHDWEKLGFRIVKEVNPNADGFLDPDDMPPFFKKLYDDLDALGNHDQTVTPEDFPEALKDVEFREHWSKLIAFHPTEWKEKSNSTKWSRLSQILESSPDVLKHEKDRIDKLVFWEDPVIQDAGLGDGNIWHFHPVAMVGNFLAKESSKAGQITYDAEGNDIPGSPYFSRHIHWPGNDLSGVTLGRGYDMGSRTETEIYNHMIAAGVDSAQATKISKAHGLKGSSASNFVTHNRADIGNITLDQQEALFDLIYPDYVAKAIVNYNHWTASLSERLEWDALSSIVKDILVDFVYQGFTKGANPMKAGMKDDVDQLISYIENTPAISQYEQGRKRAAYLRKNR
ncbi:peptidoglycan DD-metalloendopeptidase family protein [Pseudomonas sp. DR48]|uniref:peptidoglycan DD-metalloendopeptidase family protein n=1 Tax=Pseudomonas sp. DR48 TaxID=2871095 RepID=UPI001C9A21F9|nr:peptidoglycan DD-metalloendopeptidase family protein [Pseudomonas sp. DR48]QZP34359.1 peptidoglycan DD-metalloendopeptidase family protein [Pseudomonas sp. DR48]